MLEDLREHYHQVVFATGAPIDRKLSVPGEDLIGSHSATEFVAWYNGHPDFANLTFLSFSNLNPTLVGFPLASKNARFDSSIGIAFGKRPP